MSESKLKVIFVGGFREAATDGSVGGVMHACRTLLQSPLSDFVHWLPIDSTMETLPAPPLSRRARLAMARLRQFTSLLKRERPDTALIFSSFGTSLLEKGLMVILAHRAGVGTILSPRSGLILKGLERSRFWRWWTKCVLHRCDRVLCQSESWKRIYISYTGVSEEKFVVIRNWIDTRPYRTLNLPVDGTATRVLYLGWFEEYKGVHDLVEMLHHRRTDLGSSKLVMCGRGTEFDRITRRVHELGLDKQVELPGWVKGEEKLRQLELADIFVLPSHYEGFPNALLEAMAAGRAVVATAVGGVPELVTNGSLGLVVPARDVRALGDAVVKLVRDPELRHTLGQDARAHVIAKHDIQVVWPQVWQVLRQARSKVH